MGDWFESRDGGRAEEEEEDYAARATACNMQKGPPRLELERLFQVLECRWGGGIGLFMGAWEGRREFGVQLGAYGIREPDARFILNFITSRTCQGTWRKKEHAPGAKPEPRTTGVGSVKYRGQTCI